jgi:hypothetical protein
MRFRDLRVRRRYVGRSQDLKKGAWQDGWVYTPLQRDWLRVSHFGEAAEGVG